ncbi:MAG TPA: excisionase family DNA-binding protein [Bacteroidales bacterium]|nr:excisionase family DNA-binding protein [Bacteroidales bacterium]
MSTNISVQKICEFCGKEFTAKTLTTKYCCHRCNSMDYKKKKREQKLAAFEESKNKYEPEVLTKTLAVQKLDFLSIDEAATLLGASRRTIQRLIAKGMIQVTKLGTRTIIKRTTIDKLFV